MGELVELPKVGPGPSLGVKGPGRARHPAGYLDEAERGPGRQDDVLVGELVFHVLFQTFFLVDSPVIYHVEECPR